jgi:hypothetical protein
VDQVGAFEIARRADGAQTDKEQQQRTELKSVPRVRMVSLAHEKRVSHPVAFVLTKVKLEGSPVLGAKMRRSDFKMRTSVDYFVKNL